MELRSNAAAMKVAQIKLSKEECAFDMEQRRDYVAVKDAQMLSSKEECVKGTEIADPKYA